MRCVNARPDPIFLGDEVDGVGADGAEVRYVVGGELDDLPAGDGAGVADVAAEVEVEGVGGEECAGGAEVAGSGGEVELRGEDFLGAAVGEGDLAFDEPDDVAGELGDLGGGEGDAGDELPGLGDGDGAGHEGLVLGLVAGVAVEKPPPGELGDLFAQALLFVEAVTETFLGGGGVDGELGEQSGVATVNRKKGLKLEWGRRVALVVKIISTRSLFATNYCSFGLASHPASRSCLWACSQEIHQVDVSFARRPRCWLLC